MTKILQALLPVSGMLLWIATNAATAQDAALLAKGEYLARARRLHRLSYRA